MFYLNQLNCGGTTIRDYTYDYSYVGNYALNLNAYGKMINLVNVAIQKLLNLKLLKEGHTSALNVKKYNIFLSFK